MKRMLASEFKRQCLRVLEEVRATREPALITKRGRPVAKLVPADETAQFLGRLQGIVKIQGDIESPVETVGGVGGIAMILLDAHTLVWRFQSQAKRMALRHGLARDAQVAVSVLANPAEFTSTAGDVYLCHVSAQGACRW